MDTNLPDERLKPLLYHLEATIHLQYRRSPRLRDVDVVDALHQLQSELRDPGVASRDPLARALVEALRAWPPGEYDANDWAIALRLLVASAKRHRRMDGPRGYLEFVTRYAPLPGEPEQ